MTAKRKITIDPASLRWSCRRGMLELDLLLGQFLERGFAALSPEEQSSFKEFLSSTDQDLFNWLMGRCPPTEARWLPLLQKIREYLPCKSP